MHIMMVPPGTKPEFPFICKNHKWETLDLAQITVCTSPSEGNSSLPYFFLLSACQMSKKKKKKEGDGYSCVWSQSWQQGKEASGTSVARCLHSGAWSKGKLGGKLSCSYGYVCPEHQTSTEGVVLAPWKAMAVSQQDAFREREGGKQRSEYDSKGAEASGKNRYLCKTSSWVLFFKWAAQCLHAGQHCLPEALPQAALQEPAKCSYYGKQRLRKLLLGFTKPLCF